MATPAAHQPQDHRLLSNILFFSLLPAGCRLFGSQCLQLDDRAQAYACKLGDDDSSLAVALHNLQLDDRAHCCRLGDDDPRCGPASLQRFEGEDLSIADRTRAQQEQSSEWWQMQQEQHARRKAMEKARADREQELVSQA